MLLVGGGSGGHITPPLAVAHELKKRHPDTVIHYAIEKGSKFLPLPSRSKDIAVTHTVFAGKFRRYHGESFLQHLKDIPTIIKNIRDFFIFSLGLVQCIVLVGRLRPDAVFIKGGFVGVPVGLACVLWRIPYFTHDSDTVPGLANRLIARWAKVHAVGMPVEFYNYPPHKTRFVGIPISHDFRPVDHKKQRAYQASLGLETTGPVMCVTGGSLGAQRLNAAVQNVLPSLVKKFPTLHILHQTGNTDKNLYHDLEPDLRSHVTEFAHVSDLYRYTGAADLVIARAGATTIAELAQQHKACLLMPNPLLTGGQQSKNAQHLEHAEAAMIITEAQALDVARFSKAIQSLLNSKHQRDILAAHIGRLAKPTAAADIAQILTHLAQGRPV